MAKPAFYSSTHSTPKKRLTKFWGRTICVDDFMTARVNHYIAGKAILKFSTLERTLSAVLYVHGNLSEFLRAYLIIKIENFVFCSNLYGAYKLLSFVIKIKNIL